MKTLMVTAVLVAALALTAPLSAQEYHVYFGNLHAHTSISDGKLMPSDAYTYARNTAHLDIEAVTDHVEQITADEWKQEKDMADAANEDGKFVALAGYEWGSPTYDHLNFTAV